MWHVVNGSEMIPSDYSTNVTKHQIGIKKDNLTKAIITQIIKAGLVICTCKTCQGIMGHIPFIIQPNQIRSIMLWFRRLTKQIPSDGDVSTHVTSFQNAIYYLANAEFNIPGYIIAAILSTDPRDPHSWNQHVADCYDTRKIYI